MLFFDGVERSCVKWKKGKGGVARCASFEEGRKFPTCPGQGLKGGGRSQNYIRKDVKRCKTVGKVTSKRARRRSK